MDRLKSFFMVFMLLLVSVSFFGQDVNAIENEEFDILEKEFIDQDPDEDEISGTLTFTVNQNDLQYVESYDLGFNFYTRGEVIIGGLQPVGQNTYTITIPENTPIPENTGRLHLRSNFLPEVMDITSRTLHIPFLDYATTMLNQENASLDATSELKVQYNYWGEEDALRYDFGIYSKYYSSNGRNFDITYTDSDASMASLYFLDASGKKISAIGNVHLENGFSNYELHKTLHSIPEQAVSIGVFAKNLQGESVNYIAVPLYKNYEYLNNSISFVDQDSDSNEISGILTWGKLKNESVIRRYSVYIVSPEEATAFLPVKKKLGEVAAANQETYSMTIPANTKLDENDQLIILPEFEGYYNGFNYFEVRFTDKNPETMKPRVFSADDVKVSKENGRIAFRFNDINRDESINVYEDANGEEKIGTVAGSAGSFFIRYEKAEGIVENIYISITNSFGEESNIVGFGIGHLYKGWFLDENWKWIFLNQKGNLATGWLQDGGYWYYMDASGSMETGWVQDGNAWYYLNSNGVMKTGWLQSGDTWYYFENSGAMKTGWLQSGGKWYYFEGSGAMKTGWLSSGGVWYYFEGSGAMKTGWLQSGGTWYYFEGSGAMKTGWLYTGGIWYYFKSSGAMQTGWAYISGKWYYFEGNGVLK
jgi:hypothetical protein